MRKSGKTLSALVLSMLFFSSVAPAGLYAEEVPAGTGDSAIVSMEFEGAALKDVLKVLSQQSGLNFATSQDVEQKQVTVYFDHVPANEALESIVTANGLIYEKKSNNVYMISAPVQSEGVTLQTRVIHLKYTRASISPLDVGGAATIKELKTSETISTIGAGSTGAGSGAGQPGGESANQKQSEGDQKGAAIVTEKGIDQLVASLLSESGKVAIDMGTNSLIVTDTPERLNQVEKVIAQIDVPSRQVILQVHMMEVKKDIINDQGVEWGGDNGTLLNFQGGSRTTAFPFDERIFKRARGVEASTVADPSTLTLGTLSAENLAAALHFITTQSDTKILARPRVLTLNNEAANIRLVTNTATARLNLLSSGGAITTLQTGGAERTAVGVILKITPQINDDGTVNLFLEPSVTTVAASTFFPADFLDPTTRSIRTMARVKNDETLVLGGLVNNNDSLTKKKVPVLSALPVVGKAFEYEHKANNDTELLIFITPHIVEGYDSMSVPSATALTQDVEARNLVNRFREDEYRRIMGPIETGEVTSRPLYQQEKELMVKNAKNIVTPAAEQAMSQAIGSDPKKFSAPKKPAAVK